jgi:hypothetical protein
MRFNVPARMLLFKAMPSLVASLPHLIHPLHRWATGLERKYVMSDEGLEYGE